MDFSYIYIYIGQRYSIPWVWNIIPYPSARTHPPPPRARPSSHGPASVFLALVQCGSTVPQILLAVSFFHARADVCVVRVPPSAPFVILFAHGDSAAGSTGASLLALCRCMEHECPVFIF
jgi:hypothetical protein